MTEQNMSYGKDNSIDFKQPIYLIIKGFNTESIKAIVRNYNEEIVNKSVDFCLAEFDLCSLPEDVKRNIDILTQRNMFRVCQVDGFVKLFENVKQRQSKAYMVVSDMSQRKTILEAAKSIGVFVVFLKVSESGFLEQWPKFDKTNTQNRIPKPSRNDRSDRTSCFTIKAKPEQLIVSVIKPKEKIDVGSVLYNSAGKAYKLARKEMINNGAVSYGTEETGIWIKVYNDDALNTIVEEKIKRMLTHNLSCKGICWPIEIAKDSNGTFRGFFFAEPKGEPLHLSVLKESGIKNYFPQWDKKNLTMLLKTILQKIIFLHDNGILFGCINPASIRVVSDQEIYITDTDNLQVEGFPTTVYNRSFAPPNHIGEHIYLVNKDEENFSIAELVFMVMMVGKSPYGEGIITDPDKLIKDMKFLYPNGKIHGKGALPGMSRFMWSHLSPFKYPLYETLQNGGKYNGEGQRRDARFWLSVVKRYLEELENPQDVESLQLFPKTFKRIPGAVFYKCDYCGVEHPDFFYSRQNWKFPNTLQQFHICNECFNKQSDVYYDCKTCGRRFYYTNSIAMFHRLKKESDSSWSDQKHCDECKKKTRKCIDCGESFSYYYLKNGRCHDCNEKYRNATYRTLQCRECGRTFEFTNGEHEFYVEKGWDIPVKCKNCRGKKNGHTSYSSGATSYTGYSSNKSTTSNSTPNKKSFWDKLFGN